MRSRRSTKPIWPGFGGSVMIRELRGDEEGLWTLPGRSDDHHSTYMPTSPAVPAAFAARRPFPFDLRPFTPAGRDGVWAAGGPPRPPHRPDPDRAARGGPHRTRPDHLDQFRQWLTQADPTVTIRPVLDPAATAAVTPTRSPNDSAGHDRQASRIGVAVQPRHHHPHRWPARPRPHHPAHQARPTRPDVDGQPRTAHPDRAPGEDFGWVAGPTTRSRHLPVAITRRTRRGHHQPRHPPARRPPLGPPGLDRRAPGSPT